MSRKQDFDPNAIPNFGGAGRVGEVDPNETEEQQSSAQIAGSDPDAQTDPASGVAPGDPAATEAGMAGAPARDAAPGGSRAEPGETPPAGGAPRREQARTVRDDRARGEVRSHSDSPEPVAQGPGSIDGLVGAP